METQKAYYHFRESGQEVLPFSSQQTIGTYYVDSKDNAWRIDSIVFQVGRLPQVYLVKVTYWEVFKTEFANWSSCNSTKK